MSRPALHHINLKTTRLAEMIDWYGKVTGMTVSHQAPVGAWLSNDAANHRIALLAFPWLSDDASKEGHTGLHHTAFEYPTFQELFDNYARLRDIGIVPALCLDHGLTTSMYYSDPDANYVELQVDNFGDWSKSKEWMKTSPNLPPIRSACFSIPRSSTTPISPAAPPRSFMWPSRQDSSFPTPCRLSARRQYKANTKSLRSEPIIEW